MLTQDLLAEVTATRDVQQAIELLLTGIKAKLDEALASGNPADIQAAIQQLADGRAEMTAAIVANTPAAPPQ